MKRFPLIFVICAVFLCGFLIWDQHRMDTSLITGVYYADGEFQKGQTPLVRVMSEESMVSICAGDALPYGVNGRFCVRDDVVTVWTDGGEYTFRLQNEKTLILQDWPDDTYLLPIEKGFAFRFASEDIFAVMQ